MRRRVIGLVLVLFMACGVVVLALVAVARSDEQRIGALLDQLDQEAKKTLVIMVESADAPPPPCRCAAIVAELEPLLVRRRRLLLDCRAFIVRRDRLVSEDAMNRDSIANDEQFRLGKSKFESGDVKGANEHFREVLRGPKKRAPATSEIR